MLIAIGFTGAERALPEASARGSTERGTIAAEGYATAADGVFAPATPAAASR